MKKKQRKAKLRVCARCMWIFKNICVSEFQIDCPKCHFAHYSAHWVFGKKAYHFAKTQGPWYKLKMDNYASKLLKEIETDKVELPKFIFPDVPEPQRPKKISEEPFRPVWWL